MFIGVSTAHKSIKHLVLSTDFLLLEISRKAVAVLSVCSCKKPQATTTITHARNSISLLLFVLNSKDDNHLDSTNTHNFKNEKEIYCEQKVK